MKERLDVLLVKRNLAASREKAKAIIMSGNVYVDNQKEDKPGTTFLEESKIEVRGHTLPYVRADGAAAGRMVERTRERCAAAAAAWLHGTAGDLCARRLSESGMLPTDLIETLPRLL